MLIDVAGAVVWLWALAAVGCTAWFVGVATIHRWPASARMCLVDRVGDLDRIKRRVRLEYAFYTSVRWSLVEKDWDVVPLTEVPGYRYACILPGKVALNEPRHVEVDRRVFAMFYRTFDMWTVSELWELRNRAVAASRLDRRIPFRVIILLTAEYPIPGDSMTVEKHPSRKYISLEFEENMTHYKVFQLLPSEDSAPRILACSVTVRTQIRLGDVSLDTILLPILSITHLSPFLVSE
jgi:hypothetical protein